MEAYLPDADGRKQVITNFFATSGQQFLPILELLMDAKEQLHAFTTRWAWRPSKGCWNFRPRRSPARRTPAKPRRPPRTPSAQFVGTTIRKACGRGSEQTSREASAFAYATRRGGQSQEIEPPAYTVLKNDPQLHGA